MAGGNVDSVSLLRTCPLSELPQLVERIGNVNMRDRWGGTALHHLNDSPERCKMLLQLGANVNHRDSGGLTPLHLVRNAEICKILLQNGADVNAIDNYGQTPLHYLQSNDICQILIENGADIDAKTNRGHSPLMKVVDNSMERYDIIHIILSNNPDARTVNEYDKKNALCYGVSRFIEAGRLDLIEILFNFTYDEFQEPVMWKLISELARFPDLCHIFKQLVETCSEVDFFDPTSMQEHCCFLNDLFQFEPCNLRQFLDKFKHTVVSSLKCVRICSNPSRYGCIKLFNDFTKSEQILNIMLEYDLLEEFTWQYERPFYRKCQNFMRESNDLDQITKLSLTFLSYGMNLEDTFLEEIYNKFGYCELFQILLHCDFIRTDGKRVSQMARFIYDINFSIDVFMEHPSLGCMYEKNLLQLLEQFAHPTIVEHLQFRFTYSYNDCEDVVAKVNRIPKVRKLLELARNSARQQIVKKFNMHNSRQFYMYLQHLEISQVYKDILSFRKKMYEYDG